MAAIALPDIGSICSHGWPIITLHMGHVSQSSAAWMVFAYSFVEFYQYILSLVSGETLKIRLV